MPSKSSKSSIPSIPSAASKSSMSTIMLPIFTVIIFVVEMYVLVTSLEWILNLEKTDCKCSEDFRREYIKYCLMLNIVITPIFTFYNIYKVIYGNNAKENIYITSVRLITSILFIVNLIFSLQYIQNLKNDNCVCSEDRRREIYYIYNWIRVALILLAALIAIVSFFMLSYVFLQLRKK